MIKITFSRVINNSGRHFYLSIKIKANCISLKDISKECKITNQLVEKLSTFQFWRSHQINRLSVIIFICLYVIIIIKYEISIISNRDSSVYEHFQQRLEAIALIKRNNWVILNIKLMAAR